MQVVIADDSLLAREGVARVLGDEQFDVVAKVASAEDDAGRASASSSCLRA